MKPKGRRRWSFGKSSHQPSCTEPKDHAADKQEPNPYSKQEQELPYQTPDMSLATSCSATPVHHMVTHRVYSHEDLAAIRIQAAFRAYLVCNFAKLFTYSVLNLLKIFATNTLALNILEFGSPCRHVERCELSKA